MASTKVGKTRLAAPLTLVSLLSMLLLPSLSSAGEGTRLVGYTDVDFQGDSVEVSSDLSLIEPLQEWHSNVTSLDLLTEEWVILYSKPHFKGEQLRIKGPLSIRDLGQVPRMVGPCFLGSFRLPLNWLEQEISLKFPGKEYVPDECGTNCTAENGCGRFLRR